MAEDALNAKTMNVKGKQIGDIFCSWCLQMGVSRTCKGTVFIAVDPWKWPNTWSTRWRSIFLFWEIEIKINFRRQMGRWQEWRRAWGRSSRRDLDLKLSKVEYFFTTLVNNLMFAICRKEARRVSGLVGAGRGLQRHQVIAGGGRCCKGWKTLLVAQVHPWVSTYGVLLQVPKQDFQFKMIVWLHCFVTGTTPTSARRETSLATPRAFCKEFSLLTAWWHLRSVKSTSSPANGTTNFFQMMSNNLYLFQVHASLSRRGNRT